MAAYTNSDRYGFDDRLEIIVDAHNTGKPVTVDVYLVLTYDLNGLEEGHWSASFTDELWR